MFVPSAVLFFTAAANAQELEARRGIFQFALRVTTCTVQAMLMFVQYLLFENTHNVFFLLSLIRIATLNVVVPLYCLDIKHLMGSSLFSTFVVVHQSLLVACWIIQVVACFLLPNSIATLSILCVMDAVSALFTFFAVKALGVEESHWQALKYHVAQVLTMDVFRAQQATMLGQLPVVTLDKDQEDVCSICLFLMKRSERVRVLPSCKHTYHAACIEPWLNENVTCPYCRNHFWH